MRRGLGTPRNAGTYLRSQSTTCDHTLSLPVPADAKDGRPELLPCPGPFNRIAERQLIGSLRYVRDRIAKGD